MAKGSIAKGKKGPSIHSRAARRATSPGIDTDKSLKQVRPPQESIDRRPAVLAAHQSGGVTKKAKSGRKAVLSTRARRRQERSMDKAEAIMDRTAVKVQKSKGHARVIYGRRKTWDEVNREAFEIEEQQKLGRKAKAKMEEDAAVEAFWADEDGDAEMEGAGEDGADGEVVVAGGAAEAVSVPVAAAVAPVDVVEEEEIL